MTRKIVGFHQDQRREWVAELECGHGQHVRHAPPYQDRAWVLTPEGRQQFIGVPVECKLCDEEAAQGRKGERE
jgi:hypothetical protein